MVATVLATTGELAKVAGPGLRRYMTELLPPIIEAIQDTALPSKSITAVTTLGQAGLPASPRPSPPSPLSPDSATAGLMQPRPPLAPPVARWLSFF